MGAERIFMKIKELPVTERPYEKLELYGEKMLSNSELLAIIIKNGTKDQTAIDIANVILSKINNNLKELQNITFAELMNIQGIGKVKAIELKAVCELTKRMSRPINDTKIQIKNTKDSYLKNGSFFVFFIEKYYKLAIILQNC